MNLDVLYSALDMMIDYVRLIRKDPAQARNLQKIHMILPGGGGGKLWP